jgi:hypothetical protein
LLVLGERHLLLLLGVQLGGQAQCRVVDACWIKESKGQIKYFSHWHK